MSVTFAARALDGSRIALDIEDPNHLNLSSANARAFLHFLGIEPGDEPSGEVSIHEARRAIIRAGATFDRRVGGFVRSGSDAKKPGQVRVIVGVIDEAYFDRRLADFERLLVVVSEMAATIIAWD